MSDTLRARNRERIRRHAEKAQEIGRKLLPGVGWTIDIQRALTEVAEALRIVADELEEMEK